MFNAMILFNKELSTEMMWNSLALFHVTSKNPNVDMLRLQEYHKSAECIKLLLCQKHEISNKSMKQLLVKMSMKQSLNLVT